MTKGLLGRAENFSLVEKFHSLNCDCQLVQNELGPKNVPLEGE